jgi:hypothetical protein
MSSPGPDRARCRRRPEAKIRSDVRKKVSFSTALLPNRGAVDFKESCAPGSVLSSLLSGTVRSGLSGTPSAPIPPPVAHVEDLLLGHELTFWPRLSNSAGDGLRVRGGKTHRGSIPVPARQSPETRPGAPRQASMSVRRTHCLVPTDDFVWPGESVHQPDRLDEGVGAVGYFGCFSARAESFRGAHS